MPPASSSDLAAQVGGRALGISRAWILAALFAIACVVAPLALVRLPPITDLPQHLVQIRLLIETLAGSTADYRVQWLAPYGLSYLALGVGWCLAEPVTAGKIGVGLLLALWVGSMFAVARARKRPVASALLATTLASSVSLYWGFLPFLGGFPLFLYWVHRTERSERPDPIHLPEALDILILALVATALYLTHAQWFAVAGLWLLLAGLAARLPLRAHLARGLALAPGILLGLLWLRTAAERNFNSPPLWLVSPLRRLLPEELVTVLPGGIQGVGSALLLAFYVAWLGGAWLGARATRRSIAGAKPAAVASDRRLLGAGLLLLALGLLMPEYFMSLWAGKRWWAPGLALVLLGAPLPPVPIHRRAAAGVGQSAWRLPALPALAAIAALVLLAWSGRTVSAWRRFERIELAGLETSLAALPDNSRLLGLDYVRTSRIVEGTPFLQQFAWGQAIHGGSTNFSFAEYPPSLVITRVRALPAWTHRLEWQPLGVRRSDFTHFDYVLVHGDHDLLNEFPRRAPLEPVTGTEPWRLYRVIRDPGLNSPAPK